MTGRVTRPKDQDDFPSLRDRRPGMWWVAIILVVALVASVAGGLIAVLLGI